MEGADIIPEDIRNAYTEVSSPSSANEWMTIAPDANGVFALVSTGEGLAALRASLASHECTYAYLRYLDCYFVVLLWCAPTVPGEFRARVKKFKSEFKKFCAHRLVMALSNPDNLTDDLLKIKLEIAPKKRKAATLQRKKKSSTLPRKFPQNWESSMEKLIISGASDIELPRPKSGRPPLHPKDTAATEPSVRSPSSSEDGDLPRRRKNRKGSDTSANSDPASATNATSSELSSPTKEPPPLASATSNDEGLSSSTEGAVPATTAPPADEATHATEEDAAPAAALPSAEDALPVAATTKSEEVAATSPKEIVPSTDGDNNVADAAVTGEERTSPLPVLLVQVTSPTPVEDNRTKLLVNGAENADSTEDAATEITDLSRAKSLVVVATQSPVEGPVLRRKTAEYAAKRSKSLGRHFKSFSYDNDGNKLTQKKRYPSSTLSANSAMTATDWFRNYPAVHAIEIGEICIAVLDNKIVTDEDELVFSREDEILVISKEGPARWKGSVGDKEGFFNPAKVRGKPKQSPSSSFGSDNFIVHRRAISDEQENGADFMITWDVFTEENVMDWLDAAGFAQYADMFLDGTEISEEEAMKDNIILSGEQQSALLKRIRFLNARLKSGHHSPKQQQPQQPLPNNIKSPPNSVFATSSTDSSSTVQSDNSTPIRKSHSFEAEPNNGAHTWAGIGDPRVAALGSPFASPSSPNWIRSLTRSRSKQKKRSKMISELSSVEMDRARKFAMLAFTGLIEGSNVHRRFNFTQKLLRKEVIKVLSKAKQDDRPKDSNQIFGVDLAETVEHHGSASRWSPGTIPTICQLLFQQLSKEDVLKTPGMMRKSGNSSRIAELKRQCDQTGGNIDLSDVSPYDLSGLLKLYLAELPDPLFTSDLYKSYVAVSKLPNDRRTRISSLQYLSILLPEAHRNLAGCLLKYLSMLWCFREENLMDMKNLALSLGPTLFADKSQKVKDFVLPHHRDRQPTVAQMDKERLRIEAIVPVLELMIEVHHVLWLVPIELQEQVESFLSSHPDAAATTGSRSANNRTRSRPRSSSNAERNKSM